MNSVNSARRGGNKRKNEQGFFATLVLRTRLIADRFVSAVNCAQNRTVHEQMPLKVGSEQEGGESAWIRQRPAADDKRKYPPDFRE